MHENCSSVGDDGKILYRNLSSSLIEENIQARNH